MKVVLISFLISSIISDANLDSLIQSTSLQINDADTSIGDIFLAAGHGKNLINDISQKHQHKKSSEYMEGKECKHTCKNSFRQCEKECGEPSTTAGYECKESCKETKKTCKDACKNEPTPNVSPEPLSSAFPSTAAPIIISSVMPETLDYQEDMEGREACKHICKNACRQCKKECGEPSNTAGYECKEACKETKRTCKDACKNEPTPSVSATPESYVPFTSAPHISASAPMPEPMVPNVSAISEIASNISQLVASSLAVYPAVTATPIPPGGSSPTAQNASTSANPKKTPVPNPWAHPPPKSCSHSTNINYKIITSLLVLQLSEFV
jgi:hypothetical protein